MAERPTTTEQRPLSVSARALMRNALPSVHRDRLPDGPPALVERWLGGLEFLLDPVAALLDNLPAHLDPQMTPEDLLMVVASWLGIPPADVTVEAQRNFIAKAIAISRHRGTAAGLGFVLGLGLPGLRLTIWHSGSVTWSPDPESSVPAPPAVVEIRHRDELTAQQRAAIDALARDQVPVNVPYRLVPEDGPG